MNKAPQAGNQIGIVVIGRNEGERLRRCLDSALGQYAPVIYVDSGSTDDSVRMAIDMGVGVVELDMSSPFCAARARNEGVEALVKLNSEVRFIQFVDGDCEIIDNWLPTAASALANDHKLAVVAGWLHERFPKNSIYNRLGDLEWNFSGAGKVDSVGGIFMIRREAFDSVGGFDRTVPAGEEPELCNRLKQQGWDLQRLDHEMAWHDLAMTRFSQWWRRMIRFGYGSKDVAIRFGLPRFKRNNLRAQAWSVWLLTALFLGIALAAVPLGSLGTLAILMCIALWPTQLVRIAFRTWRKGQPLKLAAAYGFFIMISFWPQMIGQVLWILDHARKRSFRLLEYKSPRAN